MATSATAPASTSKRSASRWRFSPRAPRRAEWWIVRSACATCLQPWSTCWGFRRARRSQAALWRPTGTRRPGKCPRGSPPQPSRSRSSATAFQPQPGSGRGHIGFQMSLVASGHHYLRDGMGTEALYDLRSDPFELVNLVGSSYGNQAMGVFRKMLLEVLTDNPGSIEVNKAYLEAYKQAAQSHHPGKLPAASRHRPLNRHRSCLWNPTRNSQRHIVDT